MLPQTTSSGIDSIDPAPQLHLVRKDIEQHDSLVKRYRRFQNTVSGIRWLTLFEATKRYWIQRSNSCENHLAARRAWGRVSISPVLRYMHQAIG